MILKRGVEAWNRWRECAGDPDLRDADLRDANLRGADLKGASLSLAQMSGANLSDAYLFGANLSGAVLDRADLRSSHLFRANLVGARLHFANLHGADLSEAILIIADLCGADLGGVNLSRADLWDASLDGVDFTGAITQHTAFANCDLRNAKGLDLVTHRGPSTIGIDTIYKSKGKIPEAFLRGCGVPESFITEMLSLVNAEEGIQFYSCFISYSSKDEEFARRLHGRMRDAHLRVWFAPEDIQGGQKLHEQIETAIRVYDKLLIVLSEASLQSEWVMTELRKARKAERQSGQRKLFPVRLVDFETLRDRECFDADSGKDLAVELREYFIPDFSDWKDHDSFETAFARLLNDLRTEESAK